MILAAPWQESAPVNRRSWLLAAALALALHLGLLWSLAAEQVAPQFRIAKEISVALIKTAAPRTQGAPAAVAKPEPQPQPQPTRQPTPATQQQQPTPEPVRQPHQQAAPAATAADREGAAALDSPAPRMQPDSAADYSAAFLNNTPPRYPMAARRRGFEGRVILHVETLATGACGNIEIQQSSGHAILDEAAVDAVKRWHFVPASHAGRPVEQWLRIPVRFQLSSAE